MQRNVKLVTSNNFIMNKYVDIFRKSIVDFLIAFYVSFGDIYHSFAVNEET
jgi:hypothetical protein